MTGVCEYLCHGVLATNKFLRVQGMPGHAIGLILLAFGSPLLAVVAKTAQPQPCLLTNAFRLDFIHQQKQSAGNVKNFANQSASIPIIMFACLPLFLDNQDRH